MILQAYTVYDTATSAYMRPFFCHSNGEAVRLFTDTCNDKNTPIGSHPADYILFRIGTYDDANALLDSILPLNLGSALEFIKHNEGFPYDPSEQIGDEPPVLRDKLSGNSA